MNKAEAFFVGFVLGFLSGRLGHVMLGDYPGYHHWILGAIIVVIGAVSGSMVAVGYGFGLAISDLDDMLAGRTETPSQADNTTPRQFWGTD